jgi:exopolysaccharide biosynthesis polyprenyl glycosylphosphotransferase
MSLVLKEKTHPEDEIKKLNKIINLKTASCPYWLARNFDLQNRHPLQWFLKRSTELFLCTAGIILISPILILVAVFIKLESGGSVFFKQERVGLYGRRFQMYKFRSMKEDAEKNFNSLKQMNESNEKMFKIKNDPRITKIGKFLRKYSIDELPQLFNVIKGEMSLVGPRPPIPREVKEYELWHHLRFAAKPGITGIWQVSGRAKIRDFDTVVKMDYEYIRRWCIMLDIYLLLKTVPVVITAKGAS